MTKFSTRELSITSLFTAMVFVFTYAIKVQIPPSNMGGLVHLGNIPFFLACIFFGKRVGMFSGAFGMGLFDITSGYLLWSPITFITSLIMGYVLSEMTYKKLNFKNLILAFIMMTFIKVAGYYIGEIIIFKSLIVPLGSIPGNIIQIVTSSVILLIIIKPFERIMKSLRF